MIAFDDPVVLFIGFLVLVALWQVRRFAPIGVMLMRVRRVRVGARRIASVRVAARRIAVIGAGAVAVILVGALAVGLLSPTPSLPPSRLVGWRLADGFLGTPRFDPTTAQTATAVPISVDWLGCAPQDDSWLAPPAVSYTPSSITITMHTTDAFAATTTCGGGNVEGRLGIMLDVGIPVEVHLSEPLGNRLLLDGTASPAAVRWSP